MAIRFRNPLKLALQMCLCALFSSVLHSQEQTPTHKPDRTLLLQASAEEFRTIVQAAPEIDGTRARLQVISQRLSELATLCESEELSPALVQRLDELGKEANVLLTTWTGKERAKSIVAGVFGETLGALVLEFSNSGGWAKKGPNGFVELQRVWTTYQPYLNKVSDADPMALAKAKLAYVVLTDSTDAKLRAQIASLNSGDSSRRSSKEIAVASTNPDSRYKRAAAEAEANAILERFSPFDPNDRLSDFAFSKEIQDLIKKRTDELDLHQRHAQLREELERALERPTENPDR